MAAIKPFPSQAGEGSYRVEYRPYDAGLPAAFEAVRSIITDALPGAQVEHVGSSAIPGVGGRNVLDVALPADPADHPRITERLLSLGFHESPFEHYLPLLVGTVAQEGVDYPVLVYVVAPDSEVYRGWVEFRDHMRVHPQDACAYDAAKQRATGGRAVEGDAYQQAKTPFLVSMMRKIGPTQPG